MAHLAQTPTNMSSIGEVCDRLGKTFLMSLLGNLSATGGLRVNSSSVKGGVISFSLFLLEGNAILPRTPKAACGQGFVKSAEEKGHLLNQLISSSQRSL